MNLPTLADMQAERRASQKGVPSVLVKEEKRKTKERRADVFRREVWARDSGKDRATGHPVVRAGTDYKTVGNVHHRLKRSTHPAHVYDVENGILLSQYTHRLVETRCPRAAQFHVIEMTGPDDLGEPQLFTWRDLDGHITKQRTG